MSGVEGRESQAMRESTLKNKWGPKVHACQKERLINKGLYISPKRTWQ